MSTLDKPKNPFFLFSFFPFFTSRDPFPSARLYGISEQADQTKDEYAKKR
jgi:hypothetical protein